MARILVVDDEADMRLALSNVLVRTGHQVVEAADGEAALDLLGRDAVELVLLDMRLPGMDGVQILTRIRERDKDLPVIMVTGYGSVDSAIEVMRLGASHYLAKPFSNRELIETVERTLAGRRVPSGVGAGRELRPSGGGALAAMAASVPSVLGPRVAPAAGAKELLWAGVTLAALALLAWPLGRHWLDSGREFEVPYTHASALAWSGESLWAADWFTQTVYEQKLDGAALKTLRAVPLPHAHVTGLAVTPDALYLSDGWKRTIQKRKLDAGLSVVATYKSPGSSPSGLFWDGKYLWSSDAHEGKIYQHEPDDALTVIATYASPGKTPVALFKDERFLWSADADTRVLYQHRLDTQLRVLAAYHLPVLDEGSQPLSSFTLRGDTALLARDGVPRLLERTLRSFHVRQKL